MNIQDFEPGVGEEHFHFVGCRQMADRGVSRPGYREQHITTLTLKHVIHCKDSPRFYDSSSLFVHFVLGRYVHRDVNGHRSIELIVCKRQICRVSLLELHPLAEIYPIRHNSRNVAKCLCQIEAGYMATVFLGKSSRRPSQAAADV